MMKEIPLNDREFETVDGVLYVFELGLKKAGLSTNYYRKEKSIGNKRLQFIDHPYNRNFSLVAYETMSKNHREKIVEYFGDPYEHVAAQPILKMLPDVPEDARIFYNKHEYGNSLPLPPTHINQCCRYVQWLLLLDRFISDKTIKKEIKTELNLNMVQFGIAMQRLIQKEQATGRVGKKHGCSWRRLVANVKVLKGEKESSNGRTGFSAFIDSNYGNKNPQKVTDDTVELLNNLFRKQSHKPTPQEVGDQFLAFKRGEMDMIMDETGELLNPHDYPDLSFATIIHWLSKWENKGPAKVLRTGNRQLLINEEIPSHKKFAPLYAGSKLSIDDRQPPFEYGPSKRVWFYMGIDLCSHAWTCWVHGKTKEELLLNFYRQMVRNYCEWGLNLPYELECEMSLNSQYQTSLLADGAMFNKVQMEANNARGKRIERHFRTMRYEIEKRDEGWIPRPFARSESNRAGVKNTEDKPRYLTYDTIVERSLAHIAEWNNAEHPKHKGMSRWEVFMKMQNPNLSPINWRPILEYIGHSTRTSVNAGQLLLQGGDWLLGNDNQVSTGQQLINYLKSVNQKEVIIKWLDGNDGNVLRAHIYTTDGRYICQAIRKPAYNTAAIEQTDDDRAAITTLSKYVATVTGFLNEQKSLAEAITVIDNRPKFKPAMVFKMPGLDYADITEDEAENLGDAGEEMPVISNPNTPTWRQKFLNS